MADDRPNWKEIKYEGNQRPVPRQSHALFGCGGHLYIYGGWVSTETSRFLFDFWKVQVNKMNDGNLYDEKALVWKKGEPGPYARASHSMDVLRSWENFTEGKFRCQVIMFGGLSAYPRQQQFFFNETWILEVGGTKDLNKPNQPFKYFETWHRLDHIHTGSPEARAMHATGVIGNHLYLFGGLRADSGVAHFFADTWRFHSSSDSSSPSWEKLYTRAASYKTGVPLARFMHAGTAVSVTGADGMKTENFIIYGGRRADHTTETWVTLNDVWSLDVNTLRWSLLEQKSNVAIRRSGHTVNSYLNHIVTFGGYERVYSRRGDTIAYVYNSLIGFQVDEVPYDWCDVPQTNYGPSVRFAHASIVHKGILYVHGGRFKTWDDDMWAIDLKRYNTSSSQKQSCHTESAHRKILGPQWDTYAILVVAACTTLVCCVCGIRFGNVVTGAPPNARIQMVHVNPQVHLSAEDRQKLIDSLEVTKYCELETNESNLTSESDGEKEKVKEKEKDDNDIPLRKQFSSKQSTCAICIADYEPDDLLRVLPCGHNFHKDCIDQWFKQSLLCPFCKKDIRTTNEETAVEIQPSDEGEEAPTQPPPPPPRSEHGSASSNNDDRVSEDREDISDQVITTSPLIEN